MDSNGKSDPFCIIRVDKKTHKTSTKMKTLDPVWNETFSFRSKDVAAANGTVLFELFDKDQWTSDDFLGRVRNCFIIRAHSDASLACCLQAEINIHEILTEPEQTEAIELELAKKWNLHSMFSAKHHSKSLGHVRCISIEDSF